MADDRFLASGSEAGTAPEDRKFRPDVQGLRAVAVLLVVLFHAGVSGLSGGYVGVDVFFVISGFVITGVLLRERQSTCSTSILAFYARRARRIIPAATVVIILVVMASYHLLGVVVGSQTAVDGRWAALFLANFHFAAAGTNYLASQRPPSPLQNYWSLAVEEQFYLVYPAMFLLAVRVPIRMTERMRLATLLVIVATVSFAFSIVQTSSNPSAAYFSPFTRAWELALGGLVAVSANRLQQVPTAIAAGMTWLGMGAVLVAASVFGSETAYPGSAVAVPVIGAALVISGGTASPAWGVESCLRLRPIQWLGLISYSLYLWHWPILTIAAERQGVSSLPRADNVLLMLLAVVLATLTYLLIENPIRHLRTLVARRWASIAAGGCLIVSSVAVTSAEAQIPNSALAAIRPGNRCPSPTRAEVAPLRAALAAQRHTSEASPLNGRPVPMLVVGDSTACTMLPGLEAVGSSYGVKVVNAALIGCGVVSDTLPPYFIGGINLTIDSKYCGREAQSVEDSALRNASPRIVLWSSIWERTTIVGNDGRVLLPGSSAWKDTLLQRMDQRLLQFAERGATTFILTQPPAVDPGKPTSPTSSDKLFLQLNALLRELAARNPHDVVLVDLAAHVCPSGPPCPYVLDGLTIRGDGEHYSPTSSLWLAKWLVPQVLADVKRFDGSVP